MPNKIDYQVAEIPMSEIFADPEFNCRGDISPLDVKALADDIGANGLQFPITVQPYTEKPPFIYRVIAGHRRHMACRILGKESIPAMIRSDVNETEAKILNLTENLQRQALNIYQEAVAIKHLGVNHTVEWIAKKLNMSKGWVQPRIMLLDLPTEIQEEAKAGLITQTVIRDCYSIRNDRDAMFELVRKHKENRERGEKITIRSTKNNPKVKRRRVPWEIRQLMTMIAKQFGFGLTTRALAWASGEINDQEMIETMVEIAAKSGVIFLPPEGGCIIKMTETINN